MPRKIKFKGSLPLQKLRRKKQGNSGEETIRGSTDPNMDHPRGFPQGIHSSHSFKTDEHLLTYVLKTFLIGSLAE